ncbi:hypothetical protein Q4E93_20300 [Flavitalea sp. BT771]|uniref:hypothetical protein n=1 Tax=Flavitalea sp. BT771 TaxID=3063329 RepID=UPI0026E204CC|nr:hypothetical protein [Flavitalea sp. BT771]MDO6432961.1 hypothetical protein [Flavitalea sp. BT771]MDV6221763.1 hypothetical protein [Flavitalea sp. BT771]
MPSREMDNWINDLYGGDPIKGNLSLQRLIEQGQQAEELLLTTPMRDPKTQQVYRRLYKFIATRGSGLAEKLVRRMSGRVDYRDGHKLAELFAGFSDHRPALQLLGDHLDLKNDLIGREYFLRAWGYAGGGGGVLWHMAKRDSLNWEKLTTHAFRGVCDTSSRMHEDDLWFLEQFLTHKWVDYSGLTPIANDPEAYQRFAVDEHEIGSAANYSFLRWRRGAVADKIIGDWSAHGNWRVRSFGAQILAAMGFQRVQQSVKEWLARETNGQIKTNLYHALERCDSTKSADILLEEYFKGQPVDMYLVRVAWRASDKEAALQALRQIAARETSVGSEALVSMAKLGCTSEHTESRLMSKDFYCRLTAALSLAYLQDKKAGPTLTSLYHESAKSLERIMVKAALAILGGDNAAQHLHNELVRGAEEPDYFDRSDLFFMHYFIQTAVLDGFGASAEGSDLYQGAWMQEFRPLDPVPVPPAPALGSGPEPVPGSGPEPTPGSGPEPTPGSVPAPAIGSAPIPATGFTPAPAPASRPTPAQESAKRPGSRGAPHPIAPKASIPVQPLQRTASQPLKLLFLSAQPYDRSRLDLEFDKIVEMVEDVVAEGKIYIMPPVLEANYERLLFNLKKHPNVLHFSGHGVEEGICLKNDLTGKTELLENAELTDAFKDRSGYLQLVFLSSCFSEIQAELISRLGIYTLGFNIEIEPSVANLLIQKFYFGFCVQDGAVDIEKAIKIGCTNVAKAYPGNIRNVSLWKEGQRIDYKTLK